jgi:hypothetical protein
MFRDREERHIAQLSHEIAPYRNMATDLEAEDRLRATDSELVLAGRHLLTSNDRYQMTAAHLSLARNRTILTNAIADNYTTPSPDFKGNNFNYESVSAFLVGNYRHIKSGIETADTIYGAVGFTANDEYIDQFNTLNSSLQWPAAENISRNFVAAGVSSVDTILAYTLHRYDEIMRPGSAVPNDFKFHLKRRVQPLVAEVDAKRRAIDRVTGGAASMITSQVMLTEVYEDVREAIRILDEITVWTTMPRLYESTFTLRDPIDETRPEQRRFDPETLGETATGTVAQRPMPSGRPFSPDTLQTAEAPPTVSARPFNPGILEPPHRTPAPARPFDPDGLQQKPAPAARPFDPSALETPADRRKPRPFDPSAIERKSKEQDT